MTSDTVFDMASITKPVATASSVMLLVEQGKIDLAAPVSQYIPDFGQNGKEEVTVYQLLTHQSGLLPDNSIDDYNDGPAAALDRIHALPLRAPPRTRFIYSDVNFITLGELVQTVSGMNVHEFSRHHIYEPLSMSETGYLPPDERRQRAAPTEQREGRWMQGEVHDPRAYKLDGVAGHAGLFSTAEDLAVFAQMLLGGGEYQGVRILKPETVELMTRGNEVPGGGYRALGWDSRSGYSSNRGDLLSARAFGHGGFTGTVLWIDPELDLFYIFLSNRVHPDGKGLVNPLAGRIGTVAAAAIVDAPEAVPTRRAHRLQEVLIGIDVLERDGFAALRGRRVGLITNHTGVNRRGVPTPQLLYDAEGVELKRLFSPEHGIVGQLDISNVADGVDEQTSLPIVSLYGENRAPPAESLEGLDTLVFDIQDIGARFYTYVATMQNAMKSAAEHKLRFVVLDRPNPINGVAVEGPVLDEGSQSFVGWHTVPVRHGMTVGELATMFNRELSLELDLQIIKVEGWNRDAYYDETGLTWINQSPNMRSLTAAVLYPGIGLLETTNLSVGRGTDRPFEVLGAPWIDGAVLARALNTEGLSSVRFVPIRFTPESSKFAGEQCGGVNILVTDRSCFEPVFCGLKIAETLRRIYPDQWETAQFNRLLADKATFDAIVAGRSADEVRALYQKEFNEFRERRQSCLLY
jgi:uncharacterized protein YbbC (DUF1343 family)